MQTEKKTTGTRLSHLDPLLLPLVPGHGRLMYLRGIHSQNQTLWHFVAQIPACLRRTIACLVRDFGQTQLGWRPISTRGDSIKHVILSKPTLHTKSVCLRLHHTRSIWSLKKGTTSAHRSDCLNAKRKNTARPKAIPLSTCSSTSCTPGTVVQRNKDFSVRHQ